MELDGAARLDRRATDRGQGDASRGDARAASGKLGEPCSVGSSGALTLVMNASDCESRLCLDSAHLGAPAALCTRSCASDQDCAGTTSACPGGMTCGPVLATGSAACCGLCVCKAFTASGRVTHPLCPTFKSCTL